MIHGLKVSMAKGTGKREILETDGSHNTTASVLSTWKASLKALHDALAANEQSWTNFLSTYTFFNNAAVSIYSERDADIHGILKTLEEGRAAAQTQQQPSDGSYSPAQGVEISRQEITTMLARIGNAEALHMKRLEATREYRYYDSKTKQIFENERKKGSAPSGKELERRGRNQKKVMDLAIQLNSITTQFYTELEYIDMERLAITDRATAALLTFQKAIFETQPAAKAIDQANSVRVGRRVIPRNEVRQWMPNTLNPVNPNPNVPDPNMSNSSVSTPATPPSHHMSPAYQQQNYYPQGQQPHQSAQPQLQHVPSAPTEQPHQPSAQPMYQMPPGLQQQFPPQPPNMNPQTMQPQPPVAHQPPTGGAPPPPPPPGNAPPPASTGNNTSYSLPASVGSTQGPSTAQPLG